MMAATGHPLQAQRHTYLSHDRNPIGQYHPSDDLTHLCVKISVGRSRFGEQEKEVDSTELHYFGQRRESLAGKSPNVVALGL